MAITIWQVLTAIAPILAPVVSLFLILVGRVLWNHEQRIRSLEESGTRQSRTIYGDEKDPQQDGLAQDMMAQTEKLDEIEDRIDAIERMLNDLK